MTANIWNYKEWITDTEPRSLDSFYTLALKGSGFSVLGQLEHHFQPYGYTKLWLLGESHLAIHTFPEEGKTYVELSSCNKAMYDRFVALMHATDKDR